MEITGFGGSAESTKGYVQLALRVRPIVALTRFHVINLEVSYHVLLGCPWIHKHCLIPSTYHQCVKGRLNGRPVRIPANHNPFSQGKVSFVDSVVGSSMFSFMDGYSGYNQICMVAKDAKKTAFRTSIGNFYCTVMPFGLKNAGATYQRTMIAIFHYIMHKEMEDYVDDIVVKSKTRAGHLQVLEQVFERCRKYKLCMNPMKCAFGVSVGKFLGFLVHHRGISVDLAKAIVIATMKRPTTVRELKSFLGRVSYIRRFVLGLASIISGLSKLLKRGAEFTWETEQQEAFQRIQQIMNHLPTLQALVRG